MSDNDTGVSRKSDGDRDELARFIQGVEAFEIDPGDKALRFVDRLARENAWTTTYAERVIFEYKRFAILAMRCGHPVTPSEQVDQAWHLHLTYTRSYWDRFREVLGGPLHHGPTEGGTSEHEKYLDWYTRTLTSYQRMFGTEPPPDIWPSPSERFAHAGQWRWINTARCWTLPKRQVRIASGLGVVGAASLAWQLTGDAPSDQSVTAASLDPTVAVMFPFTLDGSAFLQLYGTLCLLLLVAILAARFGRNRREERHAAQVLASEPGLASELSLEELAVLSGGGVRLTHLGLVRLITNGHITTADDTKRPFEASSSKHEALSELVGLDRDLYQAVSLKEPSRGLVTSTRPYFDRHQERLVELGLRRPRGFIAPKLVAPFVLVLALGALRVAQGIANQEPYGFLVMMVIGLAAVWPVLAWSKGMDPTPAGHALLGSLRADASLRPGRANGDVDDGALLVLALSGAVALNIDLDLPELPDSLTRIGNSGYTPIYGAGGCSGGGGGGGGGGGCGGGGCGGCG